LDSDGAALVMMCGRDDKPQPSAITLFEELLWLTHVVGLWTCVVDSKKQASRGLKKIANDE